MGGPNSEPFTDKELLVMHTGRRLLVTLELRDPIDLLLLPGQPLQNAKLIAPFTFDFEWQQVGLISDPSPSLHGKLSLLPRSRGGDGRVKPLSVQSLLA
jgi:hypothetical protein